MINLCLDIGNTRTKAAIFSADTAEPQHITTYTGLPKPQALLHLLNTHGIQNSIISAVGKQEEWILEMLSLHTLSFQLTHLTPIPITNAYQTPQTLGKDRLAAVVGAYYLFPQTNVLVIDAGTCITYDFLTYNGIYTGGSISPGLTMKFKALHTFTQNLPLIQFDTEQTALPNLTGNTTQNAITSGVIWGTIAELQAIIAQYEQLYGSLTVLLTGGDAIFFENNLKKPIFARPYAVLFGLNKILNYNVGIHQ